MIRLQDLLNEDINEYNSVIETILNSIYAVKQLGDKTLLTREFRGIRSGAAKITSGPIDKGKIGSAINPNSPVYLKDIANVFKTIISKFSLKHIIYCSHGSVRFHLSGPQYYMIPIGKYKTVWSEQVKDIYSDVMEFKKAGKLDEFPINSYKNIWPSGDVKEVLVDCDEYYLISMNIPIIQDYIRKQRINTPTTYTELADVLTGAIAPYRAHYTKYDWTGIDTPGDPNM